MEKYFNLNEEQKEKCKIVDIYLEDFENNVKDEAWRTYCDALGIDPACEHIKLYVCGCEFEKIEQ